MLLWRSTLPLAGQHVESLANQRPCFMWEDDLVNVSQSCSHIGIGKLLAVLLHKLCWLLLLVLGSLDLFAEDDVDGSMGVNHRCFSGWPAVNEVSIDASRRDDNIDALLALSEDCMYSSFYEARENIHPQTDD